MKKTLLAATALTTLSFSAFAADLPARTLAPVAPAPIFSWTGFYVGGSVGLISATTTLSDRVFYSTSGATARTATNGGILGINAGYNYQMGALVLGVETDIALSSANSSVDVYNNRAYTWGSKLKDLGTLRARAGYAVDRALFYVTGGLAVGNVQNSTGGFYSGLTSSSSKWTPGWTAGAGIEYALTSNWTVRGEALYVNLGKKTQVTPYNFGFGFKNTSTVARAGLNYKF